MNQDVLSNENFINAVWSESPIVIALMNENGRFIYVNSMAQRFWEYTEDELLRKRWQDLTHPEDLMSDLEMHKQLKDGEFEVPYYSMCKRYITKSGRLVWGSVTVHLLKDGDGNFLYFLSQVVPLDVLHHMNNNFFEKLAERNNSKTKTSNEKTTSDKAISEKNQIKDITSPWFKFIPEMSKGLILGIFTLLTAIIVFLADFKYNQKRIDDVEKKIENMNVKLDTSIDKMTKLLEANLKAQQGKTP
jgi:PAS domain S-box-containing protein